MIEWQILSQNVLCLSVIIWEIIKSYYLIIFGILLVYKL